MGSHANLFILLDNGSYLIKLIMLSLFLMHLKHLMSLTTVAFQWLASGFTQLQPLDTRLGRYPRIYDQKSRFTDSLTSNRKTKFPTIFNDYTPPNMT